MEMETERIDNIIRTFETFQKGGRKEEPTVTFSETLKKRSKKVEREESLSTLPTELEQSEGIKVDTLSISKEAREAYQLVKIVKIIREAPDVRKDKMEEAKRGMENGSLFTNKVNEVIAERLIL